MSNIRPNEKYWKIVIKDNIELGSLKHFTKINYDMIDTFMNATKPCKSHQHLRNLMKVHDSVYHVQPCICNQMLKKGDELNFQANDYDIESSPFT